MRPSPRQPLLDDFPSSPSSTWSLWSPSSATQDHLSPPTPDSYFSPAPAIVTPDELNVQPDKMPSVSPSKMDLHFLSEDDMSKVQVFLRNRGRWENMYNQFESSPPLRPHIPRVSPVSQDSASDDFSWEATHSALVDPNGLPDPSRYSLLIHEVSLLVGLAADDDHISSGDGCPLAPDGSKQVPDILPFNLTPTKSLAPRRHRSANLLHPTNPHAESHLSNIPTSTSITPRTDSVDPSLHSGRALPAMPRDLVAPVARHKSANIVRPCLSPRRRQGRVFHFEPPLSNAPPRNAVGLDETFTHPREPPPKPPPKPKPTPTPPASRCSSIDRLECSLMKLEAHAPSNHRKSQSEGRSFDHVAQRKDKCPSLPPPRRLKKPQLNHETMCRNPMHPAHSCDVSGPPPVSRPTLLHQYVVPRIYPAVPLDDEHREEDLTPGSFMEMDIPQALQKHHASFRQVTGKEKMKSLVGGVKRVSRGVISWGKNLTGTTKHSVIGQETTTVQSATV